MAEPHGRARRGEQFWEMLRCRNSSYSMKRFERGTAGRIRSAVDIVVENWKYYRAYCPCVGTSLRISNQKHSSYVHS